MKNRKMMELTQLILISLLVGGVLSILPTDYHFIALKFHKPPRIPPNKIITYHKHLKSHKWRAIRKRRLEKDRYRCKMFHVIPRTKNLEVHHKSYRNLGDERLSDLITLCSDCHQKIHRK